MSLLPAGAFSFLWMFRGFHMLRFLLHPVQCHSNHLDGLKQFFIFFTAHFQTFQFPVNLLHLIFQSLIYSCLVSPDNATMRSIIFASSSDTRNPTVRFLHRPFASNVLSIRFHPPFPSVPHPAYSPSLSVPLETNVHTDT